MARTLIYGSSTRSFGYATIVTYLALVVNIIYFFRKRPWCRSYTGYTAIAAALASMLYTTFGVVVFEAPQYVLPPFNLFFSLSNVCLFLPALIGFQRMSQQKKSDIGQFLAYAGYGWSIAVASTGATVTTISTSFPLEDYEHFVQYISFLNGGFVILLLVYTFVTIRRFKGTGRRMFIAFVFFFTSQAVAYSYLIHTSIADELMQAIIIAVFTFPRVVCMYIATLHGHTWTLDYQDCDEDDDSLMDDETR